MKVSELIRITNNGKIEALITTLEKEAGKFCKEQGNNCSSCKYGEYDDCLLEYIKDNDKDVDVYNLI